jgi:indole-3-glycerol phosphate synthase
MEKDSEKNLIEVILEMRRRDAQLAESKKPIPELANLIQSRQHRSLAAKIRMATDPCVITEMKKASPSTGIFVKHYDPDKIAKTYASSGAAAVSVLTEPHYFFGDIEHIKRVRNAVDLPILRKDFICNLYQVYESAAWGADVILLIATVLDPSLMTDLYQLALSLGLEILIESHSEAELEVAMKHQDALLGINNRNLQTLKTDLTIGYKLAGRIPCGRLAVIESGIKSREDVDKFWALGYKGFLIGEVLMRSPRPDRVLGELMGVLPGEESS